MLFFALHLRDTPREGLQWKAHSAGPALCPARGLGTESPTALSENQLKFITFHLKRARPKSPENQAIPPF
jgi:hypothetical protein